MAGWREVFGHDEPYADQADGVETAVETARDGGFTVVEGDGASVRSRWTHEETAWSLSVFDVTSETAVLRLETPVGRQRFFGTTQRDLATVYPALEAAPDWTRQA